MKCSKCNQHYAFGLDICHDIDCPEKKKKEIKMTHPIPTANVIDVLDAILEDMLAEEAASERGDIRVAYLQRAIEILKEVEQTENCDGQDD